MAGDVRPLASDAEFDAYLRAARYAFHVKRDDGVIDRYRATYRPEWCMGAFGDGRLVAGLTIIPFEQHMLGRRIAFGGVATVASLPQHRRQGHVGALLRAAIERMHEQGMALSGLFTPHVSLYRRYGWETACRTLTYSFSPKSVAIRYTGGQGRYECAGADRWTELAALRDALVSRRNGELSRDERRWRGEIFSTDPSEARDAVLWRNDEHEARGYAVYTQYRRTSSTSAGETVLRVIDWAALDGAAYAAILKFLLSHDLAGRIVVPAGEDEPFPAALVEPGAMQPPVLNDGLMLRIIDVKGAFEGRPALPSSNGISVRIQLDDRVAPWNSGVWRIAADNGRFEVERTSQPPELRCDSPTIAPIYNGFMSPHEAARVGALEVLADEAESRFAQMCSVSTRPSCLDDF